MSVDRLRRAALDYAAMFGFHVFPCGIGKKIPAIPGKGGFRHATNDLEQIERWWGKEYRGCGIGVWPRPSGVIVLDIDRKTPEKDGLERLHELEAKLGALPETPMQLTPSGGMHMFFEAPNEALLKHPFGSPYLELFTDNHVCLAPTRIGDKGYSWDVGAHIRETPLASLPAAWIAYAQQAGTPYDPVEHEAICDVSESLTWVLFGELGLAHYRKRSDVAWVHCPWGNEHGVNHGVRTGLGRDSSAVILAPSYDGHPGAFRCQHASCSSKSARDVAALLVPDRVSELAWKNPKHLKCLGFFGIGKIGWWKDE